MICVPSEWSAKQVRSELTEGKYKRESLLIANVPVFSLSVNALEAKEIGQSRPSSSRCDKIQPSPTSDASVLTSNVWNVSECLECQNVWNVSLSCLEISELLSGTKRPSAVERPLHVCCSK